MTRHWSSQPRHSRHTGSITGKYSLMIFTARVVYHIVNTQDITSNRITVGCWVGVTRES